MEHTPGLTNNVLCNHSGAIGNRLLDAQNRYSFFMHVKYASCTDLEMTDHQWLF